MIYSNDRSQMRRVFVDAWQKKRAGEALEPMEAAICDIVARHPEYHGVVEDEAALHREFDSGHGQVNPFLHMSLHIAIQEQVSTDRPAGIRGIFQSLLKSYLDSHKLEHALMACLEPFLWKAQQSGTPPNESEYLECARRLERRHSER